MNKELKFKTQAEIGILNTKNLLAYYKAERKRFYAFVGSFTCSCCGERFWSLNPKENKKEKLEYEERKKYLEMIKSVLNTREHIKRQ